MSDLVSTTPVPVGQFTDTKGVAVQVYVQGGDIYVQTPGLPHYPDPSPHMNASMVVGLISLLTRAVVRHLGQPEPENMLTSTDMSLTERGFKDFGEPLTDLNGHEVFVRESSAVGEPCAWLFTTDPEPRETRYAKHKAEFESWGPEKQERMLPTWIRFDYSNYTYPYEGQPKLRDYTDCPEEKAKLIDSWFHQQWPGEPDDPKSPTPRLSPEMVWHVCAHLAAFLADASDESNWRNSPAYRSAWRDEQDEAVQEAVILG